MTINALTLDGDKEAPAGHGPRIVRDRMHRTTHIASLLQNLDLPMERREQLRDGDGSRAMGLQWSFIASAIFTVSSLDTPRYLSTCSPTRRKTGAATAPPQASP